MELSPAPLPALDEFVDAILQSYGQLAMLIDHMDRYPSPPDTPPVNVVLKRLFTETLDPLAEQHGEDAVATAARLLAAATETVGKNLYFVNPDPEPLNRAERRAARRRRLH
jgi:hypothetical protein